MRVKNDLPRLPLGSRVEVIREGYGFPIGAIGFLRTITDEGERGSDVYYVSFYANESDDNDDEIAGYSEAYDLPPFAVRSKPNR